MIEKKCEIRVQSKQVMGKDTEVTEVEYPGRFVDRGEKKYLSYKRSTEDGEVDCLLSYSKGVMIMSQQGGVRSKMEFIPGKTTSNPYMTPLGNMSIPVYTRGMSFETRDDVINVMIDYDIATGDAIQTLINITARLL